MADLLHIELVYAFPDQAFRWQFELPAGSTVADALNKSGLFAMFPELAGADFRCGIYSKAVESGTELMAGDRVEVYRPLQLDPMEARRRRARKA